MVSARRLKVELGEYTFTALDLSSIYIIYMVWCVGAEVICVMCRTGNTSLRCEDFWADSMMRCRCRGLDEEVLGVG